MLTVQGHPEFSAQISRDIIKAFQKLGVVKNDDAEIGKVMAEKENDGVEVIGKAIWKFFGV